VDSQRDPGKGVIRMAPGTALRTGAGALTVALRDGAGLTNRDSGAITLQTVNAGSVSVANNLGDVNLGSVTTTGVQTYANPSGTTTVTGNLTAADSSITFTDSVAVNAGVTITAGASTVNFAGSGTQTLQSGSGTSFGNINHSGIGTLRLLSGLTVTGTFTNAAGAFDANDQSVTVAGAATVVDGTYLAGTAPQTFNGGLAITGGLFTSSTGPMTVAGGITVSGGSLSGVGTVDSVTVTSGTIAPGSNSPGVLTVGGMVALTPSTTLSILVNGPDAGTGYAQLQAGGPIDLGGSILRLAFGVEPPVGGSFEILTNAGSGLVAGTFNGLNEGALFSQGGYVFLITYQGGSGSNSIVVSRFA
jgi:fibronectin-binding autotransporter adhesin